MSPVPLRESTHAPLGCPRCGGVVDVRTRFIEVRDSAIRMYCSEACQRRASAGAEPEVAPSPPPSRVRTIALPSLVFGGLAAFGLWLGTGDADEDAAGEASLLAKPAGPPRPPPEEALVDHGPAWPPTEQERIQMLADDAWIHPLHGPERRMPIRASRAFGARRPGHRPPECNAGHCGVDLGGERWGEPVLAVQDGEIERIERDPKGNGGRYIWLAHRDGTVFTHYFHLAAIPPELQPGEPVRRGQIIGLLGGSGVNHSGPHLHFTVAVRLPGDRSRQYIDPEPLLALWPLEVPLSCDAETVVKTTEPPGRVIGSQRGWRRPPRTIASRDTSERGSSQAASVETGDEDAGQSSSAGDEEPLRPVSNLPGLSDDRSGDQSADLGLPAFTP